MAGVRGGSSAALSERKRTILSARRNWRSKISFVLEVVPEIEGRRMIVEHFLLPPGAVIPNNPDLPVLTYRQAIVTEGDRAAEFEAAFKRNGWQGTWRNGIYDYHHYHSGAHEALGIARGHGEVAGRSGRLGICRDRRRLPAPASRNRALPVIGEFWIPCHRRLPTPPACRHADNGPGCGQVDGDPSLPVARSRSSGRRRRCGLKVLAKGVLTRQHNTVRRVDIMTSGISVGNIRRLRISWLRQATRFVPAVDHAMVCPRASSADPHAKFSY